MPSSTSLGSPAASSTSDSAASSTLSPFVTYLSSLPQSVTTLILSYVDSPAYANLTTSYLNDVFNPATPNVEGVKYFSVAGRVEGMSIFHPLWLPKLILDKSEEVEQSANTHNHNHANSHNLLGRDGDKWPTSQIGRYPPHHELGNDGLVPISSAQWGEFLGTVEGADHWDIRGASGFSAQWELAGAAGGLGWVTGVDWARWGFPWIGGGSSANAKRPATEGAAKEVRSVVETAKDIAVYKQKANRSVGGEAQDEVEKMMEWIGEHMAKATSRKKSEDEAAERMKVLASASASKLDVEEPMELRTPPLKLKPLEEGKFNLERLYLALSRKLYDEGL